jgi:peroxiredoxin
MRTCNRYQTNRLTSYHKAYKPRSWDADSRSHSAKSEHVVFFFMCHSTCSHCWKQAMVLARLNDQLADYKITLMLVGDGRYRKPAQRLIEELNLPIRYISDNGALRRYYHVDVPDGRGCKWALLFVDPQGIVRFCRASRSGHINPNLGLWDFARFLSPIKTGLKNSAEHVMHRKQVNSCDRVVKLVPQ